MTAIMRLFWVLFCVPVLVASTGALAETESDRLNAFFEKVHNAAISRWPEWRTSLGLKENNHLWNDRSAAKSIAELEITIRNLELLRSRFDKTKLDPSARLSYRLFERNAEFSISWFPFRDHGYAVSHLGGMHKRIPTFLINRHRVDTRGDAEAYIKRLLGVPRVINQIIERLDRRADKGIVPPRFVFAEVAADIDSVLKGAPFETAAKDTPILADFREKVGRLKLPAEEADVLLGEAEAALSSALKPAYLKLKASMRALSLRSKGNDGVWSLPHGDAFYVLALRSRTTTEFTPDEIHDYGLAEVARIHQEMRSVKKSMNFKGDLQAFFEFIRHDPTNFYPNSDAGRAAYLEQARSHIDALTVRLDDYFRVRPKARLLVKRVEPFREKNTSIGFYRSPARLGDRPGMFYVNLRDMALMPKSHLEGLAYHEGIPGHHMQIAIAQELSGLPDFRGDAGYTAFVEGWALYAERLAKEMGGYQEPLSDFGRLAWELLRAARLVVDTGLHHKRWSRERATDYLDENLPVPHAVNAKAIDRYIVWPGQATAYKIGMREILALRDEAEARLGDRFDIRDFHQVVLGNGAIPLGVLRDLVEDWLVGGGG